MTLSRITGNALALGLAALPLYASAQQPDIRPGLWEFTMAGTGPGGQGIRQTLCFTPQMVKDMKGLAAKSDPSSDCKSANEKVSGKSRTFDVTCTKPQKYEARVTVTVEGPDNFTMAQDYVMETGGKKQQGSMKFNYRRLGECK